MTELNYLLIRLFANDTAFLYNYIPIWGTYDLCIIDDENKYDLVKELYLYITLPSLPLDIKWKNNLTEHLINSIKLNVDSNEIINMNKYSIYPKEYPDKLLFRNLNDDDIDEMSRKETLLILPINLPHVLCTLVSSLSFDIQLNYNALTNDPSFVPNIKFVVKGLCGILGASERKDFFKNNLKKDP